MKSSIVRFPLLTTVVGIAVAFSVVSWGTPGAASVRPLGTLTPVRHAGSGIVRPDKCGKPVSYPIDTSGGTFKLPSCGGTTGKITYGKNNAPASATVTITASTSNPAPSQCGSASGETTLAYVTVTSTGNGSVTYKRTKRLSRLKNASFPQQATFTLYAYAFGSPIFTESLGHPNAKGVLKFPSPLNGQTLPLGVPLCFELDTP